MSLLKKIISLTNSIPKKDVTIFEKCITERRFDDALDLITSIIILINRAEEKSYYFEIDVEPLFLLQTYLIFYIDQLNIYETNESNIIKND